MVTDSTLNKADRMKCPLLEASRLPELPINSNISNSLCLFSPITPKLREPHPNYPEINKPICFAIIHCNRSHITSQTKTLTLSLVSHGQLDF